MSPMLPRTKLALAFAIVSAATCGSVLADRGGPPPGGWHGGGTPSGGWHGAPAPRGWHGVPYGWHGGPYPHGWYNGSWNHGWHGGRYGWWWVVGGLWTFYTLPVYPYPALPVVVEQDNSPPVVVQPNTPGGGSDAGYWYRCDSPRGYYPYVKDCPGGWRPVAATPPGEVR